MAFDFIIIKDIPDSLEFIEEMLEKEGYKVSEEEFWKALKTYDLPYFADATNLYLNMAYQNFALLLKDKRGIEEDSISYYINCFDSSFYIGEVEIYDEDSLIEALREALLIKFELPTVEIEAYDIYERIALFLEENCLQTENIPYFDTNIIEVDEIMVYPKRKLEEAEIEYITHFINNEIPDFLKKCALEEQKNNNINQI